MADYDVQSLRDGIDKCRKNIKTFEQAIEDERRTIVDYRKMIDHIEHKQRLEEGITVDANEVRKNGSMVIEGVEINADPDN